MTYPILPSATLTTATDETVETVITRPYATAFLYANFTYDTSAVGDNTIQAWVQCSDDRGATWKDVACFAFAETTAKRFFNLSGLTAVTSVGTPTDGALADNTSVNGLMTQYVRVKYTISGTYSGATTLAIWMCTRDTK